MTRERQAAARPARARPLRCGVPCALVVIALSVPAHATDDDEAAALYRRGVERYAEGALGPAAALLQRAARRAKDRALRARILLHLGLNAAAQGHQQRARARFREAIREDPTLRLDPKRHKPELVRLFEEVRRDEATVAQRIVGSAAPQRRNETRPPQRSPAARTATPAPRPRQLTTPRSDARRRFWTWIAAGGALTAGAAALGLGLAARDDSAAACELLAGPAACADRRTLLEERDRASYATLYDRARAKTLGRDVCIGVAAGLAATAVVLFFVESREARDAPAPPIALRFGVGPLLSAQLSYP